MDGYFDFHENSEISPEPDLNWVPNPLLRFLVNLRQPSRTRSKNRSFGLTIPMYRLKKIKNLESENNHITIMNTFWSTELNSRPILSHEGSICVSEAQSDHFQSQKIGFRAKKSPQSKISESKTTREFSFLSSKVLVGTLWSKIGLKRSQRSE